MKKLFLLATVLSLLMASCSNDDSLVDPIDTPNAKVPVTINVTSNTEFNELKNASLKYANMAGLLYLVYDEATGNYIKHKTYGNVKQINDTLQTGKYRIALLASTKSRFQDYEYGFDETLVGHSKFKTVTHQTWGKDDFFYKDFELDVAKIPTQQYTVLDRVSSKIEIIPLDAKDAPEDLQYISFRIDSLSSQGFEFSTQSPRSWHTSPPITFSYFETYVSREELMNASSTNPITLEVLPLESPSMFYGYNKPCYFPIIASYFHGSRIEPQAIIKYTYKLERNKILRLTGNLFSNTPPSATGIYLNDGWSAEVVEQTFD